MNFRILNPLSVFVVLAICASAPGCGPEEQPYDGTGGAGTGGGITGGGGGVGTGGVASGGAAPAGVGGNPPITCGVLPGSGGSTQVVEPTFESVKFIINETPCNASDCHGHEGNELDLKTETDQELYDHLLNTVSGECGGLNVVVPGDPGNSALVRLLKGPCGELAQMPDECICDPDPYINNCLPPQYVDAVEKWIAAGAPM